jgi:DNA-binding NarL/FixJ family response regulator
VLALSQYVERLYARELLADRAGAVGYLLKDRVGDVRQFVATLRQVAAGGTVIDPDVVARLVHGSDALAVLTARERDVLRLMAEGHSNAAVAERLIITEKSVSNLINMLFAKLGLPPSTSHHRRVLAVLAYLDGRDRIRTPPTSATSREGTGSGPVPGGDRDERGPR